MQNLFPPTTLYQGYTKLLQSLGSNIVEFLSNLNSLHLHLTLGFPAMKAPAFRCDKVGRMHEVDENNLLLLQELINTVCITYQG